ncbi:MAG: mechanosensitive ion channel [Helicobacteraceae bacterium]|jgi:potassium efflux system protein|nr:mechanosensitive ion channel [Helicobacteraceae bacterium]
MRVLLFILFVTVAAWAAPIDAKLFEEADKEAYYKTIQQEVEAAAKSGQRPEELVREEMLQLAKVRNAASQAVQIERYDLTALIDSKGDLKSYYDAVSALASLQLRVEQRQKMLLDLHTKLVFLKQRIENIVKEEKPQLLSYQLQFAYYKLQQKSIEARLELLQTHKQEIMKVLLDVLPLLQCDLLTSIDSNLVQNDTVIEKSLQEKVALQIDLEKAVLEESTKIESLQQKNAQTNAKYQQALTTKIILKIQRSLCMLQKRRNKDFFEMLDEIKTLTTDLSADERPLFSEQLNVLKALAKEVFGTTKLFFGATWHESMAILSELKGFFSSTLFVVNEQPISLSSLIKALVLIVFGFVAGAFYKRWIARISRRWPDMSQMSIRLMINIGYYLIITITFVVTIGSIGIDMTSISLIAGALSIGIGFGLQTVVSNFIAGIILMFERTIRIGDIIELSDTLRGKVTDMRIRSTTIKTWDNVDIVVPNSSFIQNNVINWTLDDLSRRLHIPFGVAYGTKVEDVIKAVLEELAESDLHYISEDEAKRPEVWMITMNSSSVDFELLVWVEWNSALRPNSLRSDFMILIYNALYRHGIQIPFPQLDLYVKQMPSETLNKG